MKNHKVEWLKNLDQVGNNPTIFIGNEFINWDGFYNDNLFKLKDWLSRRLRIPIKIKVPESIDYVIFSEEIF